jgi:hypothetical protein
MTLPWRLKMAKHFKDVQVGTFFKWTSNTYVKLSSSSTKNAFCVSPINTTLATTFSLNTFVTECDVAITDKKLTLADIKIGGKFRVEDNNIVLY